MWTEGLILALVGGASGVVLGSFMLRWLRSVDGTGLPRLAEVQLGPEAVLYSVAVTLLCCLLFSLLPAVRVGGGASQRR